MASQYAEYKDRLTELLWVVRNNKTLSPRLLDKQWINNLNLNYLISDLRDSAGKLSKVQKNSMVDCIEKTLRDVVEAENNRQDVEKKMKDNEPYYSDSESESETDNSEVSESESDSDDFSEESESESDDE